MFEFDLVQLFNGLGLDVGVVPREVIQAVLVVVVRVVVETVEGLRVGVEAQLVAVRRPDDAPDLAASLAFPSWPAVDDGWLLDLVLLLDGIHSHVFFIEVSEV